MDESADQGGAEAPVKADETPTGNESPMYAGRYQTTEAFEKGFTELAKATTGEELNGKPLWGKDGHYPDVLTAELAYKALQRVATKVTQATKAKPEGDAKAEPESLTIGDGTAKATTIGDANKIIETMASRFSEKGDLEDADYEALRSLPADEWKKIVKGQFAAVKELATTKAEVKAAKGRAATDEVRRLAGGEEGMKEILDFAAENYSPEAKKAMNARLSDPDLAVTQFKEILLDYREKYPGTRGTPATPVNGRPASSATAEATDPKHFGELMRRAQQGDRAALERINATSMDTITGWMR